jgi:hypothetical protein
MNCCWLLLCTNDWGCTQVLFQGLKASASEIITIVMAFLVICAGITILQMSKVDPTSFSKLDRRSTILLQAARKQTEMVDEKNAAGAEDPGMDTVRGTFGAVGSIIRARSARRMSQSSNAASMRSRASRPYDPEGLPGSADNLRDGMQRHQLWDAPVPPGHPSPGLSAALGSKQSLTSAPSMSSLTTEVARRHTNITFDKQDVVHSYHHPGTGDNTAIHEHRLPKTPTTIPIDSLYPPSGARTTPALTIEIEEDLARTPTSGNTLRQTPQTALPPQRQQQQLQQKQQTPPRSTMTRAQLSESPEEERMAPPLNTKYARPDARELFASPTETDPGMATLPSATDSTSSDGLAPSDDERRGDAGVKHPLRSVVPGGKKSPRFGRGYPQGSDDQEESVRLWRRPSLDDSDDNIPANSSGIRLVPPSTVNKF